jgi:hypothetical protein
MVGGNFSAGFKERFLFILNGKKSKQKIILVLIVIRMLKKGARRRARTAGTESFRACAKAKPAIILAF